MSLSLLTVYPRFLTQPKNTTAYVADHIWLHCNASGDPKPKISWSKDEEGGDKLDPKRFIQHPNGTLHIKEVHLSDQGRYYCIAANRAEMKQSKFSLVVQGKENFCFELDSLNPLSPSSDQQLFSPNNVHTLSRDKVTRINKVIPYRKCPDLLSNSLNWRSVWRICMWILGVKGLIKLP